MTSTGHVQIPTLLTFLIFSGFSRRYEIKEGEAARPDRRRHDARRPPREARLPEQVLCLRLRTQPDARGSQTGASVLKRAGNEAQVGQFEPHPATLSLQNVLAIEGHYEAHIQLGVRQQKVVGTTAHM